METLETILNAADDFFNQNNYKEALKEYETALALCEADERKYSKTAMVNSQIGKVYRKKGDYEKALKSYQRAAEILKNTLGEEHFETAKVYNDIGVTYYRAGGRYEEAIQWYLKAAEIRKKVTG
jgi:tetratricopeptide (TPR) repeat protein